MFEVVQNEEGTEFWPFYFRDDYLGVEQWSRRRDEAGNLSCLPKRTRDLEKFAAMWDHNLRQQGFLEAFQRKAHPRGCGKSPMRLWLSVLAYNLGSLWRRLVLPNKIENWSLTSLQQRLVKTGGRLVKHARYYWLMLAESHLTRRLFGSMVRRIEALAVATG